MVGYVKKIISLINKFILVFNSGKISLKGNTFFIFRLKSTQSNTFKFEKTKFSKSSININGTGNSLQFKNAFIENSSITIEGDQNEIFLNSNVILRNAIIIFRGSFCSLKVGENTSFGGIRIINVGHSNAIIIGDNCLFSDHIELWASDTHPIYNENGQLINKEMPVTIGNKVWVGSRVIILKGVEIDNDSIIGMGSVVTKNIPKNVISVGCPNRTVKENITWSLYFEGK